MRFGFRIRLSYSDEEFKRSVATCAGCGKPLLTHSDVFFAYESKNPKKYSPQITLCKSCNDNKVEDLFNEENNSQEK